MSTIITLFDVLSASVPSLPSKHHKSQPPAPNHPGPRAPDRSGLYANPLPTEFIYTFILATTNHQNHPLLFLFFCVRFAMNVCQGVNIMLLLPPRPTVGEDGGHKRRSLSYKTQEGAGIWYVWYDDGEKPSRHFLCARLSMGMSFVYNTIRDNSSGLQFWTTVTMDVFVLGLEYGTLPCILIRALL